MAVINFIPMPTGQNESVGEGGGELCNISIFACTGTLNSYQ